MTRLHEFSPTALHLRIPIEPQGRKIFGFAPRPTHFLLWVVRAKRYKLAMMPILPYFALALVFSCATASSTTQREHLPPLEPAEHVDLARYVGVWYEISALPQRFQKNCTGTTATYTWRDDGDIDVLNRCRDGSLDGP